MELTKQKLEEAYRAVRNNRGTYGIDRVSIEKYGQNLGNNLKELQRLIEQKKYKPLEVKRIYIPKANGKKRPLGIPTVRDRIVQQIVLKEIEPECEKIFSKSSYGFRPNKSALEAVEEVDKYLKSGYEYIVEADIKDFFGTLNHPRLMTRVKEVIKDERTRELIWSFVKAGIIEEGQRRKAISGTPQGGVISPILANLYLNEFDHKIERAGLKLIRYADDFVILCKTVNEAVQGMKLVRMIMKKMKLELAEEKTGIREYWKGFDFLGYHFQKYYGKYKWAGDKAVKSLKEKVKRATRRLQPKNIKKVIKELNQVLRGWGNYFKYGNNKNRFEKLDSWIRMRLRSYIEKRKCMSKNWKYTNSFFRGMGLVNLRAMLVYQLKLPFPE